MQLQPGTYLQGDKYRIIRALGNGGFGITYLAEHELAGRNVCIKEFFPKEFYNRDEDSRSISLGSKGSAEIMDAYKQKFMKEAKTIARLDHPNIIHIFDVFAENNTAYYVMEYIEGESLSSIVKSEGAMSEADAQRYIRAVANALGYIHERKIMHLDIKPANVMLRKEDGRAIVIDFGLSKQYDAEGNQTSSTPVGISAGYAPMEQYQQGGVKEFSPETDIYSLGATLYYLVTGNVPPQAVNIADEGLPALPSHLSSGLRNAIERSMEIQRKRRPHSIKEFLALLNEDDRVVTPAATPTSTSDETVISIPKAEQQKPKAPKVEAPKPESPKKKSKLWVWLLLLVAIVGGIVALSGGSDDSATQPTPTVNVETERRYTEEQEAQRLAEEETAEEAEKALIAAEEQRIAEEKAAEEAKKARVAEQKRKEKEAEKERVAEQKRKEEEAEKARVAEQKRKEEETEKARVAEEKRINDMVAQGLGRDGIYRVGDYYNRNGKQGVVFEISYGGLHGKIISLDETTLQWCTTSQYRKRVTVGASSESDGKANTDKVMRRSDKNQYPAFTWCRAKGADWYLPAKKELMSIFNNESTINSTLKLYGEEQLTMDWHWSSTENSGAYAWSVRMSNGRTCDLDKCGNIPYVRAVSAF